MKNNKPTKRGGARPGAGRKPNVPNLASIARQAEVAATGETPLQYMLRIMRDAEADEKRRDEMSKAAAPYVHPKLSAIDVKADVDVQGSVTIIKLVGPA